MDKLQAMSVFVKIADDGSLTAAANSLGKSLPAVVRILSSLEEQLQVRLFNRTTRRIALTEEGNLYLARCRKILADVEETELALTAHQVEAHGTITVIAPVRFGEMHITPSVTRFLEQHPKVQINLLLLDRITNLFNEGIDLAVRIAHLEDSTLIARPVGKIQQVVVASPELLTKIGAAPTNPKQLANLPCVRCTGISNSSIWQFEKNGKRIDVHANGSFVCNQIKSTISACAAGLGFGIFFDYQVQPWINQNKLQVVLQEYEPAPLPMSLVYPHTRLAMRVRSLVDWLANDIKQALT